MLDELKSAEESLGKARHRAIDRLGEIYDQTVEDEKGLYVLMADRVPLSEASSTWNNLKKLNKFIQENPNDAGAQQVKSKLQSILFARKSILEQETALNKEFITNGNPEKNDKDS